MTYRPAWRGEPGGSEGDAVAVLSEVSILCSQPSGRDGKFHPRWNATQVIVTIAVHGTNEQRCRSYRRLRTPDSQPRIMGDGGRGLGFRRVGREPPSVPAPDREHRSRRR